MRPVPLPSRALGATVDSDGVVLHRVGAGATTRSRSCSTEDQTSAMTPARSGYFSATVPDVRAGQRYWFRLEQGLRPDPVSRFQPDGPFGPSMVVDPHAFTWTTSGWGGAQPRHRQVVYEMHIGTFTTGGTWASARERLPHLASLGITTLEVMPIAEFDGRFGWGYDGVFLFAPFHHYGTPDDARAFVDAAHSHGLGRHSRRRLQPPRSVGQLPAGVQHVVLRRARDGVGTGVQPRWRVLRARAPLHARERAALARGVSLRRPSLRRDARARRSITRRTSSTN